MPKDWVDAIMISLFKGKGLKSVCGDYRGISLLESVGKVFARLLLNRLTKWILPSVIPESQSGFRAGRGTMDMIYSVRQLQEKCIEHRLDLFQAFIDLTKAFDTVNRSALWIILGKLGCPPAFVDMIKQLHDNMQAQVNFNGSLSEQFPIDNGVKQGDILAPTLFSIYFAVALNYAFKDCDKGVYMQFRTSGSVFNVRRFKAKTLTFEALVRELLYADDVDLVAHSEEDLQFLMDRFAAACSAFGLTISLKKTKIMYTPSPGKPYFEPNITVNGTRLEVVDSFVYLRSTISKEATLDAEIRQRIEKASSAFGRLEGRVWSDRDITINTKLVVYEACVLTVLLYASETWTAYRHQIKLLERFHQNCLRRILGIKWDSLTPDTDVLQRANTSSIEKRIINNQMRWAGHMVRLEDSRLPKQMFYGELTSGKRPNHKPKMRYKDVISKNLALLKIEESNFETLANDPKKWRESIKEGCNQFEQERIQHATLKRALKKQDHGALPADLQCNFTCSICNRICLSKAGLVSHTKSHERSQNQAAYNNHLPPRPAKNACPICGKVCRSAGGLKRHMKVHDVAPSQNTARQSSMCHICQKICKSEAGLLSHLRAHGRERQLNDEI